MIAPSRAYARALFDLKKRLETGVQPSGLAAGIGAITQTVTKLSSANNELQRTFIGPREPVTTDRQFRNTRARNARASLEPHGRWLVLGNSPPSTVVINEATTVASVRTHNQFIDGTTIKGHAQSGRVLASINAETGLMHMNQGGSAFRLSHGCVWARIYLELINILHPPYRVSHLELFLSSRPGS